MKTRTIEIVPVACAVLLGLTACKEQNTQKASDQAMPSQTASADETTDGAQAIDPVIKKMDGALSGLAKQVDKGLVIDNANLDPRLSVQNDRVAIEITYDAKRISAQAIEKFKALGGTVDTVFQNKLYGWVPIEKIRASAQPDNVWSVTSAMRLAYPVTDEKPHTDESRPSTIESTENKKENINDNK